jgi:predicted nucleic-acid-binding Zn-ribbon protein
MATDLLAKGDVPRIHSKIPGILIVDDKSHKEYEIQSMHLVSCKNCGYNCYYDKDSKKNYTAVFCHMCKIRISTSSF